MRRGATRTIARRGNNLSARRSRVSRAGTLSRARDPKKARWSLLSRARLPTGPYRRRIRLFTLSGWSRKVLGAYQKGGHVRATALETPLRASENTSLGAIGSGWRATGYPQPQMEALAATRKMHRETIVRLRSPLRRKTELA